MNQPVDEKTYRKCFTIAARAHKGQMRRGGGSYFAGHVLKVAKPFRVNKEWLCACAAILHDAVEDTDLTFDRLAANGVPDEVRKAVRAITKEPGEQYTDYLERVMSNPTAWRVKIRDILHNLSDQPSRRQIIKYAKALPILLTEAPESIYP